MVMEGCQLSKKASTMSDSAGTTTAAAPITKSELEQLGLPGWLEDMLKPGVGSGVFTTLKASLIGLVLTLVILLMYIEDSTIRIHLSVFLGMSVLLLGLVIWFVGELQKETALQEAEKKKT